jgi:cytochrome c
MRRFVGPLAGAVAAALAWAGTVSGEEATLDGAKLWAERTCFACHGKDAKTPILPDYPRLAGQNEAYLLRQMLDIKSGARSNGNTAAMRGIMFLVNEEEMAVLAAYISSLERCGVEEGAK